MREDVEESLIGNIKFEKTLICRGWRKVVGQDDAQEEERWTEE
jgi:hypothetical protein